MASAMAEKKQRERRHDSPEDRDYRRRDDHRHRERSRSPYQRREGHHRDRDGFHGNDRSRGGVRDRDYQRHQVDSHEPQWRGRDYHVTDREGRSGGDRGRKRGEYDDASDEHRINRDRNKGSRDTERFRAPGASRFERRGMPHPEDGQPRDRERDRERERVDERRQPGREEEDISTYEYGGGQVKSADVAEGDGEESDKEDTSLDPNYGLSGKLTAETNTYRGVVIKYNEPEEARVPKIRWRLYPFKGDEVLPTLYIHRQSAYLIGRERKICDMPVDHPSCSKQHAVIQYRLVNYTKPDGSTGRRVRPYVIDLESTNGTYVNNQRIESARYYELKEKDMLKFGFSSREYILLHENSKGDEDDESDPEPLSDAEGEGGAGKVGRAEEESGSGQIDNNSSSSEDEKKHKKRKKKKSHKSRKTDT